MGTVYNKGVIIMDIPWGSRKYKYIRMFVNAIRGNNTYMQFSNIRFKDSGGTNFTYPTGTAISCSNSTLGGEGVENLIDNNVNTKMCCTWSSPAVITITFPSGSEIDINEYNIFEWDTANDETNRDPITWSLRGSNTQDFSDEEILNEEIKYAVTTARKTVAYSSYID